MDSTEDLARLGWTLINSIGVVFRHGHASPASSLDYVPEDFEYGPANIVYDFIAWTSGRTDVRPGCVDRLRDLTDDLTWEEAAIDGVAAHRTET